jgi:hypothetical protein
VHPNTYLTEPSNCCVTVGSQCTTPPAIPYVRVCPSRCSFARGAHPTAQSCSMHVRYTYRSPSSWTDAPTVSLTSSEREVPSGWVRCGWWVGFTLPTDAHGPVDTCQLRPPPHTTPGLRMRHLARRPSPRASRCQHSISSIERAERDEIKRRPQKDTGRGDDTSITGRSSPRSL